MSSDLQSSVESLLINNYVSLAQVVVVGYDYLITFPREVDYIWGKPWTWISTMFVILRYVGLLYIILYALVGTTFLPGPRLTYAPKFRFRTVADRTSAVVSKLIIPFHYPRMRHQYFKGIVLYLVQVWLNPIFISVVDWVMIMRVYAMWSRSKWILYALSLIFVTQIIVPVVFIGIYYNPNTYFSVTVSRVLEFSFCSYTINTTSATNWRASLPRFFIATALLVLAIVQALRQSVDMYRASRRWQPNRYVQLFVKEGFFYFTANVLFTIISAGGSNTSMTSTSVLLLGTLSSTAVYIMMPRFIIGVRELYDKDFREHWRGVDTGFGVSPQRSSSQPPAESGIEFADLAPGRSRIVEEEVDRLDVLRLPERQEGGPSRRSVEQTRMSTGAGGLRKDR